MFTTSSFETVPLAFLTQQGLHPLEDRYRLLVMVVDGEAIIAETRAAILARWGYAVLVAYDADSALEIASVIPPQLLLTDMTIGRTDGIDLAIAMRQRVPDCKVILLSEHIGGQELLGIPQHEKHAYALISKPLHPAQLWVHLAELEFENHEKLALADLN